MLISRKLINVFKGIYNEYGPVVTLNRLCNLLKLNIGQIDIDSITFTDKSIIINCKTPIIIAFEEDYYVSKRDYGTYQTYNYYDLDTRVFKKTFSFATKDGNLLVLDSMEADQLDNIRIIKTTKDDVEFNNGFYEKERMIANHYPISEEYNFLEFTNDDTDEKKIIYIGRKDLYYYHNYSYADSNHFMEAAASINTPRYKVFGRSRKTNELLEEVEKIPLPNIQFRGNVANENTSTIHYYDVQIEKDPLDGIISISISDLHEPEDLEYQDQLMIQSIARGALTPEDITALCSVFTRENYAFSEYVISELEAIKKEMRIRAAERTKEIDLIGLEMDMHPDINEFAYHIYENLDAYDEAINSLIHRELSEKRKKGLS